MQTIPFVDLYAQYETVKEDIDAAISDVIRRSLFIRGPYVQQFEEVFAEAVGVPHCISCANGTDSLYIAMRSMGIQAGDEVIAPAHSWISTSETITQAGGKVVFCDTDSETFTIDPAQIEAKITARTVGIIPVHLYGQPADMDAIMQIAERHNLWVLEDCAQAHFARYKGRMVGTFGAAASFSFYPGKNLGAMGDAGAIVTRDPELANRMTMFARHGGLNKGDHTIEGINSRLDGLQAAILLVKLAHLARWTGRRQEIARTYDNLLSSASGIRVPKQMAGREHVYHLYVLQHERRDELAQHLGMQGIQTVVNYPIALPFLPAYKHLGHLPSDFPNAFHNQSRVISIPIYPELTSDQIDFISQSVHNFQRG